MISKQLKSKETDIHSKINLSVITIYTSFGSKMNLEILNEKNNLGELNIPEKIITSYVKNSKGNDKKAFYNCLTLSFEYDSRIIKSKIFPNGSVQLPGCRSIEDTYLIPEYLLNLFKKIINLPVFKDIELVENIEDIKLGKINIAMINSNFYFKGNIKQEILKDIINNINNNNWKSASYQPEKYNGLKIKYISKLGNIITILIFKSGKVTITSAKNIDDILETYSKICDLVTRHKNKVLKIINE